MANKVTIDMRYLDHAPAVDWDISVLDKESRNKLKKRLVASIIHDEYEYRALLGYFHMKYPDLMDIYENDGKLFQWIYESYPEKIMVFDSISGKKFDMYGLVYYDPERDMEPVAVGGSYFRKIGAIRDPWTHKVIPGQEINKHTTTIRVGRGYRLFVDPNYRRLGLAQDQWITEAQLYRDCDVHYQKEIQTYAALKVTQSIFDDPNKCYILEKRNLGTLGENDHIKCVMDYFDQSLIKKFKQLPKNLKDFRNEPNWRFLEREKLTIDQLCKPWYDRFGMEQICSRSQMVENRTQAGSSLKSGKILMECQGLENTTFTIEKGFDSIITICKRGNDFKFLKNAVPTLIEFKTDKCKTGDTYIQVPIMCLVSLWNTGLKDEEYLWRSTDGNKYKILGFM